MEDAKQAEGIASEGENYSRDEFCLDKSGITSGEGARREQEEKKTPEKDEEVITR